METLRNLHESSFSNYGWTASPNSTIQLDNTSSLGCSFNAQDATSFIEMDPHVFSMRWPSSLDFAPADQIFSDGMAATSQMDSSTSSFERSVSTDSSKSFLSHRNQCTLTDVPRPISVDSSPLFYSAQSTPFVTGRRSSGKVQRKSPLLRSCTESSKKLFLRYMCFLLPLYKKVKLIQLFSRKSTSAAAASAASRNMSLNSVEWCHGNADTAVHDAILYCKRSIGQDL
ncbi:putative membrane-associated kinase regulator 6 [Carex littledalei]|uniref:Putative membrane-associated kinase regulator 6 n=1 Tax=Carex littledalei TaxID=544730 RepID=A0A833QH91_9POAL|nr:putative membrane-associated kinase regulator 6 [Carex littledalei]